ncbi:hypothetical protein HMPREF1557_01055 [Streptococcus sobrinus W1703]|uniref:Uncharacterized protein n=1 Tax=Streptococcus sobrinus W1703 TaxID=1227275 RepID=U2IR10_9STRE|nr:hypothetical protein HMPREF1557_01055 [Streptococcus sobrinus W1703]
MTWIDLTCNSSVLTGLFFCLNFLEPFMNEVNEGWNLWSDYFRH